MVATSDVPSIHHGSLAARALILSRLGRHEEAADTVVELQRLADRLGSPEVIAVATHDAGVVAFAAGRYVEAADLLDSALEQQAHVSRPGARLRQAEALALAGDADRATAALRSAVLEPVARADQPWSLVPRIAFVQALVARAQGDDAVALRRLEESEQAWRRVLASITSSETAEGYLATLVDLGRPPIVGLVEPARELARIDEVRRTLPARTSTPR